jgi:hypothetical protein
MKYRMAMLSTVVLLGVVATVTEKLKALAM